MKIYYIFGNYCSIFNNSTELFHLIFSLFLINTNIIKIWNYQTVEGEIAHKSSEIESRDKNYSGFNTFGCVQNRCLMIGDKVKFEHKGKDYDAVFKTINNKLRLVYHVDHECISFAEFIRKVTDYTKPELDENQYSKLKINDVSWKDFCEKVIFMESVMFIKNEL
ncbi:hypothetical protein RhiirA4_486528 [Rhizophagus irregularis]|uniref:Uncharacterized protein n=1 Tax=Rhizophagus irregularis TaxID=588596 RepID=A0A2I1HRG1_9GLOM|nr:hypothetical protein RhiirA4_486528 [Rhizophagus irregularis]